MLPCVPIIAIQGNIYISFYFRTSRELHRYFVPPNCTEKKNTVSWIASREKQSQNTKNFKLD